ncbi:MAG TPA: hypothetical protein VFO86_11510, partial [Terriglobia bacterium]|nr:hypothetical protein [Terriglobia bacterium]
VSIVLICAFQPSSAQTDLVPEDGPIGMLAGPDRNWPGWSKLDPREYPMQGRILASALAIPSFDVPWSVSIFCDYTDSSYTLIGMKANGDLGRAWEIPKNKADSLASTIPIRKSKRTISRRDALRMTAIFWKMTSATHYSEKIHAGIDGETYHFYAFTEGAGERAGTCWSPNPNTRTDNLVKLAKAMLKHSYADSVQSNNTLVDMHHMTQLFRIGISK